MAVRPIHCFDERHGTIFSLFLVFRDHKFSQNSIYEFQNEKLASKTIFLIFRIYQCDKVFDFCLVSMSVLGLGSRQVLAGWIFHGPIAIVSEISNFLSKYFKILCPYLGSRFINRSSGRIFNWAWLTWTWKTTYAF